MKKGKIILGIAAGILTLSSTVAFKVAAKFTGGNRVFVQTIGGLCVTCFSVRTAINGVTIASCKTINKTATIAARNGKTFWRNINVSRNCFTPVAKVVRGI